MSKLDVSRNTSTGELIIDGVTFVPKPESVRDDVDAVFWSLAEMQSELRQWRRWGREMEKHLKGAPVPPIAGEENG